MSTAYSDDTNPSPRSASPSPDKVTRFSAELFESAQAVGSKENRSARQQLEYWAKIGRTITAESNASRSRIESALAGTLARQSLSAEEAIAFDAELPARISEDLSTSNIPAERAAQGFSSVYLDDDGNLVELRPDGSVTIPDATP